MKNLSTTYEGQRKPLPGHEISTCEDAVVLVDGEELEWEHTLKLANHSPSGLNWGYGGSGTAQCALAILADFLQDNGRAMLLYREFARCVVSHLPVGGWSMDGHIIDQFVKHYESEIKNDAI